MAAGSWGQPYYSSHNAAGGGAGTIGDPYTLQELIDNTTTTGFVMATGTYTPAAQTDFDTNAGAAGAHVIIRGCASNGDDDGTVATIDYTGVGTGFSLNLSNLYVTIENLRITGATNYNVHGDEGSYFRLCNVTMDNAGSYGFYINDSSGKVDLIDCDLHTNGGGGFYASAAGRGRVTALRTLFRDNTGPGCRTSGSNIQRCRFTSCLFYDNTTFGLEDVSSAGDGLFISHCTFALNDSDGANFLTTVGRVYISDSIFEDNGGYGIDTNTGDIGDYVMVRCSEKDNSTNPIDINGNAFPTTGGSGGHVSESANFVSEANGSEDLTPQNSNLYKTIAFPAGGTTYEYIGAIQPQATGGGDKYPFPGLRR
jgi:hypothetical protein